VLIRTILERAGAEIVSIRKWDDRKLAYDISRKSRGTYILCYFRAEGGRVREIERDVQLSERIMRALILSAEHMSQQDIEKDTPASAAERSRYRAAVPAEAVQEEKVEPAAPSAPAATERKRGEKHGERVENIEQKN
jgi:small subunit ribosomal protein S6